MPPHAIIFDVDGVLVDSYQAHYESWRRLAEEHDWDFTEAEFAKTFGCTSREIIRERWGANLSDDEIKELDFRKEAIYRVMIGADFPEMPGAGPLLTSLLQASIPVAVGSSGPALNVQAVLDRLDPDGIVKVRITGDHVILGKPDPQVFLLAAEGLGVEPTECVVVEDAPMGIEAAHAAGMKCVALVSSGRKPNELQAADLVVESLEELNAAMLKELAGA